MPKAICYYGFLINKPPTVGIDSMISSTAVRHVTSRRLRLICDCCLPFFYTVTQKAVITSACEEKRINRFAASIFTEA